ncbi:MAG: hypothetical protein ACR2O6_00725 [Ilumatobacteraceae bacterium]
MSTHVYSLAVDFPNNSIDGALFATDCEIAGIGNQDGFVFTAAVAGDTVTLTFSPNLSAGEITTLDAVVAAHLGTSRLGAEDDGYKTLTYTNGKLTKVETFEDAARLNLSLTVDLTYDASGFLTSVLATNNDTGGALTKTLTYNTAGELTAVDPS